MSENYTKWVACWGNATSICDQTEAVYAKDVTFCYPIRMCFSGNKLRFHFSNLTGTQEVKIKCVCVNKETEFDRAEEQMYSVLFQSSMELVIPPGKEVVSDELSMDITAGENIEVRFYLEDYTQMNAGTFISGPLSKGIYAYGDFCEQRELPLKLRRNTNWFYFLNTIDIFTEEKNHALICYGDSITAQSWPDYLKLRLEREGIKDCAIIRRAVSGTRILREYDCITYAAYGRKGATRFPIEMQTAGAAAVLIQHGINDIIHPVGEEKNPFRPWSDMPTFIDLTEGVKKLYIEHARSLGMKVYSGTLLPILGWRTYEPFREELRQQFNTWLRQYEGFDGCADFDLAVRDEQDVRAFREGFDSGDHLHPSETAYAAMAEAVPVEYLGE